MEYAACQWVLSLIFLSNVLCTCCIAKSSFSSGIDSTISSMVAFRFLCEYIRLTSSLLHLYIVPVHILNHFLQNLIIFHSLHLPPFLFIGIFLLSNSYRPRGDPGPNIIHCISSSCAFDLLILCSGVSDKT